MYLATIGQAIKNGRVLAINNHERGGTYVKFLSGKANSGYITKWKMDAPHIAWIQMREPRPGSNLKPVEMISSLSPFDFLKRVLLCPVRDVFVFSYLEKRMNIQREAKYEQFEFRTNPEAAVPSDGARRSFAQVLKTFFPENNSLLENLGRNDEAEMQEAAASFDLESFYYDKIGDAVALDGLAWDNMKLEKADVVLAYQKAQAEKKLRQEKIEAAINMMKASDLNLQLWGALFEKIICETQGGSKSVEIQTSLDLDKYDPWTLIPFIDNYLKKIGLGNLEISLQPKLEGFLLILSV